MTETTRDKIKARVLGSLSGEATSQSNAKKSYADTHAELRRLEDTYKREHDKIVADAQRALKTKLRQHAEQFVRQSKTIAQANGHKSGAKLGSTKIAEFRASKARFLDVLFKRSKD